MSGVTIASTGFPVRPVTENAPVLKLTDNGAPIVISDLGAPFIIDGYNPQPPDGFTGVGDWQDGALYQVEFG